jgi:hypothetical protein
MDFSISLRTRSLGFYEALIATLPPRTASDRTCFRRVTAWLADGVEANRFTDDVFPVALTYAREAALATVRNPHACFISILKKELGYDPKQTR